MDLSPQNIREHLDLIAVQGWDCPQGRDLLQEVRRQVVQPVVRRSGVRGGAAAQAEASGWEAAWDALRRPSARTAQNPGGMVWVAVSRAVRAEAGSAAPADLPIAPGADGRSVRHPGPSDTATIRARQPRRPGSPMLSLDAAMDAGWQPVLDLVPAPAGLGRLLDRIADRLIARGWDGDQVRDAISLLADHLCSDRGREPSARWRWVAIRLALPEWQARRLATLLLGAAGCPGLVELMSIHGSCVLDDQDLCAAMDSTVSRRTDGPRAHLESWNRRRDRGGPPGDRPAAPGARGRRRDAMPLAARPA